MPSFIAREKCVCPALVATALLGWSGSALAADFDAQGRFSFAKDAVLTESFESFVPDAAGDSTVTVTDDPTALDGTRSLRIELHAEGFRVPLSVPPAAGTYHLRYFARGDAIGGFASDSDTPGSANVVAQAYPTGRITSDGWMEMKTGAFTVDGAAPGLDARLYLSAYDAEQPTTVDIDAAELLPEPAYTESACTGLDEENACGEGGMCLEGRCRDARGLFPPLPSAEDRKAFAAYWKAKIRRTYGPYLPRRISMPEALAAIDALEGDTTAAAFWLRFGGVIQLLRDAHTYTRFSL
jgi:hypothetical protein